MYIHSACVKCLFLHVLFSFRHHQSPGFGFGFGSKRSPKEKKDKDKTKKNKDKILDTSNESGDTIEDSEKQKGGPPLGSPQLPAYTRAYDYETTDDQKTPSRKAMPAGAFSYENQHSPTSEPENQQSPNTRRATGMAFNYAPGEEDKLAKTAEKRKTLPSDPSDQNSQPPVGWKSPAELSAAAQFARKSPKDDTAAFLAREQYHSQPPPGEKPVQPPPAGFIVPPAASAAAAKPSRTRIVKLYVITGKKDPKTNKVDADSGQIDISSASQNVDNGLIDSKYGLIDPENGTIIITDPASAQKEVVQGYVDPATGQIHVTTGVIVDPKLKRKDPSLGQIITIIADEKNKNATNPLAAVPKKKIIKIVIVTGKKDPKTNRVIAEKGHSEVSHAAVDPVSGHIETKYGVIDPKNRKIVTKDPKTGKTEVKSIEVDEATGQIIVTQGVVDPKTGKIDSSLGQVIHVSGKGDAVVEVTAVTAKRDPTSGQIDPTNAHKEVSNGKLDPATGEVVTKYGTICVKRMKIISRDPTSGQIEERPIQLDKNGNVIILTGVIDPRTGKKDNNLSQIIQVGNELDPEVKVTSTVGKVDNKKNTFDPKTVSTEHTAGVFDADKNMVYTKYGQFDPIAETLTFIDPKTGKTEVKHGQTEPVSGELLFKGGFVNPKTEKADPHFGRTIAVEISEPKVHRDVEKQPSFDAKPGAAAAAATEPASSPAKTSPVKAPVATITPADKRKVIKIMVITAKKDPKTGHLDLENGHVDHSVGILHADGKIDTKYGLIDPKSASVTITDPATGQKEVVPGHVDPASGQIIIPSGPVIDPKTGKIDTTHGQVIAIVGHKEPEAGEKRVVPNALPSHPVPKKRVIKILVITAKKDPKTNRIDAEKGTVEKLTATVDPVSGLIDTKYGRIDPNNLKVVHKDPKTGKTSVTPIEVDPLTGQIILTKDVIDPKTGKVDSSLGQLINVVDPKEPVVQIITITTRKDPKTGQIDLNSGKTETANGKINPATGEISTKQGRINLKLMKITFRDPKTGKVHEKPIQVDNQDNIIVPSGVVNPKTGAVDPNLVQVIQVGPEVDPEIQVTTYVGKVDSKKNTIDAKSATPETTVGLYDPDKDKIHTKFGLLDPVEQTLSFVEPKSGKVEVCHGHTEPTSGDIIFKGAVINHKTGKADPHMGRAMSVQITEPTVDAIAEQQVAPKETVIENIEKTKTPVVTPVKTPVKVQQSPDVVPVTAQKNIPRNRIVKIMVITAKKDPKTHKVDIENGTVEHITGIYNPQNGLVESKLGMIDPKTGKIVAHDPATGKTEVVQGQVDPATGHIHVSTGPVVDPATGKTDPNLGQVVSVVGLKAAQESPTVQPVKKRIIKIMVITTKVDPKTGKIDPEKGQIEYSTATLNPVTGYIESKYGLIDPKNGKLIVNDPKTGKVDAKSAQVDETTGQIIVGSNVIDPKTGKADPHLGQIISIVGQSDPVVEITTITGKKDQNTGTVDPNHGQMETTKGKLNSATGEVTTKYGVINLKLMRIITKDPKTGKTESRPIQIDEHGNIYLSAGVVDPKTDTQDPNMGQIIQIGSEVEPEVQIASFVGKVDSKKNTIDAKNAVPELSTGLYNPESHKVDTKFGQIDPVNGTLTYIDPKTGKTEVKQGIIDPATGQILFKGGFINPKTGKSDPNFGRIVSVTITEPEVSSAGQVTEKDPKNFKIDPKTNQIWMFDHQDPVSGQAVYSSGQIDPVTGYIITIYGYLDGKTGQISKISKVDTNNTKIDPETNQIYTKTSEVDETGEPLYSVSQIDPGTGEIYTKYGKVDPKTGKLVIIRIYLITQSDPTGKVKEIDPRDCQIDEKTGKIINVTTQTVYMYSMVDPVTGKIIQVDPNDPLVKSAKTKITQVLTLSGEIDPVTGKIHTEWGHIDPQTGEIDPKTARTDPVTGELILNYAQIDPSHFSDLKDTKVKVTTHTVGSSSEGESSDDDLDQYKADNLQDIAQLKIPKKSKTSAVSTPVIVKTTTKQVVTKDKDGVTQNIEEKVEDGRTGEVTISTQVNKVSLYFFVNFLFEA